MSSPPPPDDQEARTQRHLAFLDTLIAQGMDLTTRLYKQSTTPSDLCSALAAPGEAIPFITPDVIASLAQINHTVRRAMLLARKLAEPLKRTQAKPDPVHERTAIRKRIIREVEDAIHREASTPKADTPGADTPGTDTHGADTLRAELHERVETGDLDEQIGNRPTEEIIAEICRDLGAVSAREKARFQRRTPQDLQTLATRAARPSATRTERPNLPKANIPALNGVSKPETRPPKHGP